MPGEAVLVEFGRRQALGVVLGETTAPEGIDLKPIAARVRTDGPLLPPLSLDLARWIAAHYLAPPAIVIRAMLPPGLLERLDLVAERRPGTPPEALPAADRDLLEQIDRGPRAVRDLVAPEGRAGLIRRLRALEASGLLTLDWTLSVAGAGPRFERWIRLTDGRPSRGADPRERGSGPRDGHSDRARRPRSRNWPRPPTRKPAASPGPARRSATATERSPASPGAA